MRGANERIFGLARRINYPLYVPNKTYAANKPVRDPLRRSGKQIGFEVNLHFDPLQPRQNSARVKCRTVTDLFSRYYRKTDRIKRE